MVQTPQVSAPLVSVLIPVYRVEDFIARCLNSVLEQSYRPMEIVLCDDKSPDKAMEIAQELLETPPEGITLKLLSNSKNRGITYTRGELLKAATGKYLLWLDSDDYWDAPSNVATIVQEMERSEVEVLVLDYFVDYPKKVVRVDVHCPSSSSEVAVAMLTGKMGAFLWNKCFRIDSFRAKAGSFDPSNSIMEDIQCMIPLLARGVTIGYLPLASLHYVQYNSHSITSLLSLGTIDNWFRAIAACERVLMELNPDKYRTPIQIAYLNAKAAIMMRASYKDYPSIRRHHQEVDKFNQLRQQPWHNRFIYALQRRASTGYLGYLAARVLAYIKRISRNREV